MKSVISLLVLLFSVLSLTGQVNYRPNRSTNGKENIEDIQLTETGNYMLGSYTNVKSNKWHHDSLVVYVLDENLKEESRKVIKTGFEADLGVALIGFINKSWFFLSSTINKRKGVFEYNLMRLDINGDFESTYRWEISAITYNKKREIHYGYYVKSYPGISFNKRGFAISKIIKNKSIKTLFFDVNGKLQKEREDAFEFNKDKKPVISGYPLLDSFLDDSGDLYFVFLNYINPSIFYCSIVNGKYSETGKRMHGKKGASVNIVILNNKVSCLTTFTKKPGVIKDSPEWELFNFDDNISSVINVNEKSCNGLDFVTSKSIEKESETVFISSGKLSNSNSGYGFCIDLSIFSLKNGVISNSTLVKRKVLGSPSNEHSFKGKIFSFGDGYFVLYKDIPQVKKLKTSLKPKEETIGVKLDSNLKVIESKTMGERVAYENFSLVKKYQGKLWVPVLEGGSYMFIPID